MFLLTLPHHILHFFETESIKVLNNSICLVAYLLFRIGGSQSYHSHSGTVPRLKSMKRVLENHTVLRHGFARFWCM